MKLLREFIRENIGTMFGLDRFVTINALSDVVGGPDASTQRSPIQGMRLSHDVAPEINASTRLRGTPSIEFDALEGDLAQVVDDSPEES